MKKAVCRLTALLLSLLLLLSLPVGCAPKAPEPSLPAETPPVTEEVPVPPAGEETAGEEYTEPLAEGYNQVTFYWSYPGSYDRCDMWIWWDGKDGQGHLFHECGYGAKVVVNVPEEIGEIGFIVRRDCSAPGGSSWGSAVKDYELDRFAVIEGKETVIYLKSGDPAQYISNDGGETLTVAKKFVLAAMVDETVLRYRITPETVIADPGDIRVFRGDREVGIASLSSLGQPASYGYIELEESLDLSGVYRVEIEGYGEKTVVPMEIFDSPYFAQHYHYDGDDLGATVTPEGTLFKVWAPTASAVVLNLFESGESTAPLRSVDMMPGEQGVWEYTGDWGHGTYYTYTVTTAAGTQEAVDPYAKAAGVNGERGMVVDLDLTDPEGWEEEDRPVEMESYSQAVIWEVHVRDFSNKIQSSQYRGKYLAFTETGLVNEYGMAVGVDYLRELGVTHVHLLPVYDYATVDESDPNAGFNWGYDPKNYNVPEGSYSTDPYRGEVRITEFKQMVQALHRAGIGVIMDVVYNHTYDANSSLNRIVPYYYYRYTASGENTSASGCGNDTASERYMFGKFMVDSAAYWVEEYHLDGLRFDLMGLHDLDTMQEVEGAVHSVNPCAVLYGEGWTMGATLDGSAQANQSNIGRITPTGEAIGAVAVFNDVIRDGLKGSVFDAAGRGYINGNSGPSQSKVIFGIRGGQGLGQGWSVSDARVINYMSAHDNNTLWDKLLLSNPDSTDEQRAQMNRLGAAILMISRGTPFWQAGEEMLRTKGGDENSYRSDDSVNNLDWSVLREGSLEYGTMLYYRGLIRMRTAYGVFTDPGASVTGVEELGSGIMAVTFDDGTGGRALAVLNPHNTALPYTLEGEWNLVADGRRAGAEVLAREGGTVAVEPVSVRIYVNDGLIP